MRKLNLADDNLSERGFVHALAFTGGKVADFDPDDRPPADYIWLHVNLSLEAGQRWIKLHSGLPGQLASTFCDRFEEVGIAHFGNGTLLVLEDQVKEFDQPVDELAKLHIWIEPGRLISGRWRAMSAVDRVRFRVEVGEPPPSLSGLVNDLLHEIISDIERINRDFHKGLDDIEDNLLDNGLAGVAGRIGGLRREITRLRRRIIPLCHVLSRTDLLKNGFGMEEEDRMRLDELQNRIERANAEVLAAQEQSRLLQDELTARTGERNADNIYILSIITVLFLPLNLITGYFGMNVGGIFGVGSDDGALWVTIGMAATGLVTWGWFKAKKWL